MIERQYGAGGAVWECFHSYAHTETGPNCSNWGTEVIN